jgi:hypothetical protein
LARNWSATFGVLPHPIKNLLFTIMIKSSMLSSISRRLQVIFEC